MSLDVNGNNLKYTGITGNGVLIREIPRDGLIIHLDAANLNSYPGSGNTWYDLSGNGYNFTWNSTPSFTSNGVSSYFSTLGNKATGPASNGVGITDTSGYSVITISYTTTSQTDSAFKMYSSNTNGRGVFFHPGWSNYTIYFDQGGCCGADTRTAYGFSSTDFTNFRMWTLMSNVYTREIWMNDNKFIINTTQAATLGLLSTGIDFGGTDEGMTWDAKLNTLLIYKRMLNPYEISEIYNTFKSRLT